MPTVAPYGSWKSPLTSDLIVAGTIGLEQIVVDGLDLYWIESRPAEKGRNVIVQQGADGKIQDVTPAPFNARTRVHEYGGGAFTVHNGTVYFSNFTDQRLYRQEPGEQPSPLTPEGDWRYADGVVDARRQRLICVREDHTQPNKEAVNSVAAVPLAGGSPGVILASGHDFYSAPRLSPDGNRLAWLAWNHPNMPWDGTELWVGEFGQDGALTNQQRIAGGPEESIFQPEWSPDGTLHFVSDKTGWWNLYRWKANAIEALCPRAAEFGRPYWVFGIPTYAFMGPESILCTYIEGGNWRLAILYSKNRTLETIDLPFKELTGIRVQAGKGVMVAGAPTMAQAVLRVDPVTGRIAIVRSSSALVLDPGYMSVPEAISFPTENSQAAHAFYYPPRNKEYAAPRGELPPLLVRSHGGPTSASSSTLRLDIQYWTSRGIGILDVNYGGSTGFGRAYRQRLQRTWGIVDVDDCVNGARFLAQRGAADPERLAIRGGSAGGFTTLAALTFRDLFSAGASYYGVSDLEALAKDTHKFESRYLDGLIGPYPQRKDLYEQRSPIHFTDRLSCPVILFQGLEDKVVPPNQAEMMVDALRKKGLPVAHVAFEGEQHGFRQAANIKRSLDGELYFYGKVFGFVPADKLEPVPIENLL
ncbi:MAG TPA: prolyl oligopeptidase family serine peptidase [Gemmataceae bacterium]|nr:prolyl oligopeptidase family serine peptidase [Gemmataceae bacterium]